MASLSPVRAASSFVSRLAALTPQEWAAIADGHADSHAAARAAAGAAPVDAFGTGAREAASPELRAALRGLELPGRREAHLVLHEWLDALATPLLGDPAVSDARLGAVLHLAERAVLGLLVSDALPPAAVARLYAPFAELIPLASLGVALPARPAAPPR